MSKPENMTKGKLIERVTRNEGCTAAQAEVVVNMIFKVMREALENNGRVEIRGFGTFEVRDYPAYTGRNPKTGERVEVPPKRSPFFKAGKALKQDLNS